ncbi:TPA: cell wall synthase accessory phosphoprotein MacP [Streptococcus suis]
MGKPILTDEILEKARKGQKLEDFQDNRGFGYYSPKQSLDEEFEPNFDDEYTGYREGQTVRIPVEASVVKSRRIETIKREEFRGKVNKILFWVVILVILFILAVLFI